MEQIWTAIILGIVEGLTEFIPVSSTGHLIWVGHLLRFTGEKADSFEIFIQLGAILAVAILYRQRFWALLPLRSTHTDGISSGFSHWKGCWLLVLTTTPALLAGYLTHRFIKTYLFSTTTVALALVLGGIGILLAEKYRPVSQVKGLDAITGKLALTVGLFQCLALWPGTSRSAATIIGGVLCGLDRKTAAEYSFVCAVPIMLAATLYDLLKTWRLLQRSDLLLFAVGFIVSFLVAWLAVKSFLRLLQACSLRPFAWYRMAISPLIFWTVR
ncbi:MAG: undecaprenyl-diphosphate phosphatase [Candidatus Tectomicrobia bacterium]|uniref:Undecaprenyl-diphosphatase n=1 Tax=Tectimicrobiota bacterium TaxID=2528274 RepID=A0A933LR21_UNCTE|nr:undecaprenyl-diphosphate phosphatase [Candidatus Tectomicrobia bacterium]